MPYSYDTHTIASIAPIGAERFGDRPALGMVGERALSYSELEACSRLTAVMLIRAGVRPKNRVAILSESMPAWGIASLGIARLGAVAVPLLVDFRASQVAEILEHAGAKVAFVSKKQSVKLQGSGVTALPIEELVSLAAEVEDHAAAAIQLPDPLPDDLAAIVYTSGTTGNPKGVMLTHRNYMSDALACAAIIVLNTQDVLLSILPLAHAYEYTIGFLIPMMSGASVRYLDRPPSASALMPALASVRPTIVLSVPLVIEKTYRSAIKPALDGMKAYRLRWLRPLLERLAGAKLYRSFGGRLRFFGIGGAPLDPEVERFLLAVRWPYAIGYGLTETAPIIAASAVGKTRARAAGPALPGAEIRIVDERPADGDPSVMVGELQVRGPMVGPGYYRDEARTLESRTADGFFKTGDLGYRDDQGYYFVRGRLKSMIVGASGENIYPEEVEAELNSLPPVQESLVYGADEGLTALVCLKPDVAVSTTIAEVLESIKKDVNKRLAAFSRIVRIEHQPDAFEKTPTQKIKRFLYPRRPDSEPR